MRLIPNLAILIKTVVTSNGEMQATESQLLSLLSHCDGLITKKATNVGFQRYSTCQEILISAVPDSLPLVNAAVYHSQYQQLLLLSLFKLTCPSHPLLPRQRARQFSFGEEAPLVEVRLSSSLLQQDGLPQRPLALRISGMSKF